MPTKKTKVMGYWLQKEHLTVATRWSASVIMVIELMHSNTFKRKLAFSFTVIGLKQLSTIIFVTKVVEYKVILKFKNNLYVLLCTRAL